MASPPAEVFTVLAQLCGPKVNETEMGAALFTKTGEGRNFYFDLISISINVFQVYFATMILVMDRGSVASVFCAEGPGFLAGSRRCLVIPPPVHLAVN